MRFENEGMSLWFGTPDAPGPGDTVSAGIEIAVTIAVQPGDRSNKVEVVYRVDTGPDQTVPAIWLRNDARANVQYFRAHLPARSARNTVNYIPVCRRAGRTVPSAADIQNGRSSFRVVDSTAAATENAPPRETEPVVADAAKQAAPPTPPTAAKTLEKITPAPIMPGSGTVSAVARQPPVGEPNLPNGRGVTQARPQEAASNTSRAGPQHPAANPGPELLSRTVDAILASTAEKEAVRTQLQSAKGDWTVAIADLKSKLPPASFKKVELAQSLAVWTGDNVHVAQAVLAVKPDLANLRDVAVNFNVDKLAQVIDPKAVPETTPGATAEEKQRNFAVALRQKLFGAEPTAVLHRMVEDVEVPIADSAVRSGITKFLSDQPDFNIRTTSVYTALKQADALNGIPEADRAGVVEHLKILQRVQAISPVPEAVPALMTANLTSALHVAEKPESTFLKAFSPTLGEDTARQVYTNAINAHIRNEHALTTLHQTMRGTGLAIIDGKPQTLEARAAGLQQVADQNNVPLNLSTLFGSLDYCECDECLSVYSPTSYLVELFQFLRNNDLDPKNPKTGQKGIAGTPLEKLFRRRPDLGCLELTCENTFTVLPYIDLVNEVMESFVVHLDAYHKDENDPKQATLEAFNVDGETSSELLAIPQHLNYDAYCILKNAVYPFTLPYHQPIDATQIFLNYLGTSRWELLDTYRTAKEDCQSATLSDADEKELQTLHMTIQDRAVDAEFLGLTQEEYIILTKEAFWPKRYFEITQQTTYTDDEYRKNIGVQPVCEYYGYAADADMLSLDEDETTGQKGLTFIKKQFLPRTGIQYTDVVELLKTQFINPNFPQSQALRMLEAIRFSYRFLQTLVDGSSKDPKIRFAKLIAFLETWQPLVPAIYAWLHPDLCKQPKVDLCAAHEDFQTWVYCYFEPMGQLIVLESGQGPQLPIEGQLFGPQITGKPQPIGTLRKDGSIVDLTGAVLLGQVTITTGIYRDGEIVDQKGSHVGWVADTDRKNFQNNFPVAVAWPVIWQQQDLNNTTLSIWNNGEYKGSIRENGALEGPFENVLFWLPARDTCDLEKVRLTHLDGTSVTVEEYDRLQRFVRLWRKLGWTIDETDKALMGLAATAQKSTVPAICDYVDFTSFGGGVREIGAEWECRSAQSWTCPDILQVDHDITPGFLHQLRAVRKLLDSTGLPLPKLLAFWADIDTAGEKSLYSKLFLTHNLIAIDSVFEADANGNYLTQSAKITDHIPVLMAAFKLKADDIGAIMGIGAVADALTLSNVSLIYRYSLVAKILHIRVPLLQDVGDLFGGPFKSAWDTLALLEIWGKMEDAGFTFRQLDYLILNRDDKLRPLAPSQKTILQLTKTLYDGLNAIDHDHPDITRKEDATTDLVGVNAGLLFEQAVVLKIIGLLEGTSVYTTNAPSGLQLSIPDSLQAKLKYSTQKDAIPPAAAIQVTGILTDQEKTETKALSNSTDWPKAIDRVSKQASNVFSDALFGIFPNAAEAQANLLSGDFNNPSQPQDSANTSLNKRFYFLQKFLPFLREQLAQRLVVETLSAAAALPSDVTNLLLSEILLVGTPAQPAMKALENIKNQPQGGPAGWKGYLIPSSDAAYTFVAIGDTQPAALSIGGQLIPFPHQQEDPSNVWSSDPIKLKSGNLYWLEVLDRPAGQLQWKTAISPRATIPLSALLPDYSSQGTADAFTLLYKAALVVNGFNLSVNEASYLQTHAADFDNFDFNAVTLQCWKRLQAYTDVRNNLPRTDTSLIDLFQWASHPDDPVKLSEKVAAVMPWKKENIEKLIAPEHFDLNRPEGFRNEVDLFKLRQALIVADKIAVDIDRLFDWAKPGPKFWVCHQIAEDIRKAIRARFDEDVWEQVVKPLNDQLREHQKQALIAYLLVQQDLIDWGVVDADSLFEFFLIDVQMDACMETSRVKQAISGVQLFIQRCLLGLEEKQVNGTEVGVPNNIIDRDRWDWMQRYRVWEANRKVFLYPENWIVSELRDDKSPFYKELESELLQKDINNQTVQDALKSYLYKVDEVANLKVVGLFQEERTDANGKKLATKLHVFGRTRNAPYFFYYRYYNVDETNWYPWEKVQVDIPCYDVENDGSISNHGAYLIPVVWNGRLLIFFPQFFKKTKPNPTGDSRTFQDIGATRPSDSKAIAFWEIKMGWSEYRDGKWTQKQLSTDAFVNSNDASEPPAIDKYEFVPNDVGDALFLNAYWDKSNAGGPIRAFRFQGSKLQVNEPLDILNNNFPTEDFHYVATAASRQSQKVSRIYSLQSQGVVAHAPLFGQEPYFEDQVHKGMTATVDEAILAPQGASSVRFRHAFIHALLGQIATGGIASMFGFYRDRIGDTDKLDAFGADPQSIYNELKKPYAIYNWEAAFHAPMLLVDRLLNAQQFEQALQMCHYILNPFAEGDPSNDKRFWQFPPFSEVDSENVLQKLFLSLQPGQPNTEINDWRNKPFRPHVIARGRPAAYMMWVAMTYIRILIAWGDYLFRQDTIESINQATQLYVLAAHVYGPRGQKIPKRGKVLPESYNSLLDKWDAFGNAMVELELAFPFSNQTVFPIGVNNGVAGLANVFGFATTLYFGIPDNPELTALRDTIDDRLFKIRHCENIVGVFRQLPLFEPPIDPGLLVQAAAQGLSLATVLNDLNGPIPNYRFYFLLQKALEVCNELKALGGAFLSAKEKVDAEALARLRASHETSIQNLVMEVRKQQVEEAQKSLEALQQSRLGPVNRMQHYIRLIGEDLNEVPSDTADFEGLTDTIEPPADESGLKLISYEKEEMDKADTARLLQIGTGAMETLASSMNMIPTFSVNLEPFGVGASISFGGSNFGASFQAMARVIQIFSNDLSYQSTNASRKAGFLRQLQDRVLQANIAGYEIKNFDKQILTQNIRINIANQEITNQQKQIDNAKEVEDFLRSKYTNQELYAWMEGQVRTLYYQAYTLAYDLAKKAEKAFRFERGLTASSANSNFIQYGYWDPAYDGLFAGERLYIGLKQLEAAYQEKRGYDFEIVKNISLQQLNPLALIALRETGRCEFTLPEFLFDVGYPGHYMRRIKSVALTFACLVGPPTSMNCVLRLLEHKFRTSAIATGKNDYPEHTDETDDRFSTVNVPITSIAVSTGQNDSGVFELNFRDERYIPFEGAGAISKWRIELPDTFHEFDYESVTDVVIHLRHTALDGGDKLRAVAADWVKEYVKSVEDLSRDEGLFAFFDLRHDFPNEWYKATQPPAGATERVMTLGNVFERLPIFTRGTPPAKILGTDVYLFTAPGVTAANLALVQGSDEYTFADGQAAGKLSSFVAHDVGPMTNWQLKINDVTTQLDQLWLVARYTLN